MTTSKTSPQTEVDIGGGYPAGSMTLVSPDGVTYVIGSGWKLTKFSTTVGNQFVELTKDGFQITPLRPVVYGSLPEETLSSVNSSAWTWTSIFSKLRTWFSSQATL